MAKTKIYNSNYYVYKNHVNKKNIKNIFNILNKIIMHIFLLVIDIEFVILSQNFHYLTIQFGKLLKYFKINHGNKA